MDDFNLKLRQAALAAQKKANALLQKQRRIPTPIQQKPKPKPPESHSNGLTPAMVAALQAAEKRIQEDPRAKELVDKAEVARRVEAVRRKLNIGNIKPAPELEFGRPIQAPREEGPMPVPTETVGQKLKKTRAKTTPEKKDDQE